jgi:lysophospholipase L1-like esterase
MHPGRCHSVVSDLSFVARDLVAGSWEAVIPFLALGDSYTIGESVDPSERWTSHLVRRLRSEGIAIDEPVVVAKTGWTTDELAAAIDAASPEGPFDLVSLLIGVNNQYRGRSVDEYREQFAALLDRAVAFAGGDPRHVVVLSIPDWGVTPFAAKEGRDPIAVARDIDAFNAVGFRIATERRARYVDVTHVSRRATHEPDLLASDGLHPSGRMYDEWSWLACNTVRQILRGHLSS